MADLLVHYGVAHALGRPLGRVEDRAVFALGNFLPDVAFKALYFIGGSSTLFAEATHAPLVLPAVAALAAFVFAAPYRARAFVLLLIGSALHVLVDAGKDYVGFGVILWGFPFTFDQFEFGLYVADDVLPQWIAAAALIAVSEFVALAWRRRGRARRAPDPANDGNGPAAAV